MSMNQNNYTEIFLEFWNGEITRKGYLDKLYNSFGPFEVQKHEKDGFISKRRDWLTAREMPFLMNSVNHRTPCGCEVVFDIDLPSWLNHEERLQILRMTVRRLKEHKIYPMAFDTGRGFHLHWMDNELRSLLAILGTKSVQRIRDEYVSKILKDVRSDMMLVRTNHTIQLEGVKHWKRDAIVTLLNPETLAKTTAKQK